MVHHPYILEGCQAVVKFDPNVDPKLFDRRHDLLLIESGKFGPGDQDKALQQVGRSGGDPVFDLIPEPGLTKQVQQGCDPVPDNRLKSVFQGRFQGPDRVVSQQKNAFMDFPECLFVRFIHQADQGIECRFRDAGIHAGSQQVIVSAGRGRAG